MLFFLDIKTNNPRLTQKQTSKQLGVSDSTIKQFRDDVKMNTTNNGKIYKEKTTKQKQSNTTQDRSTKKKSKHVTVKKTKNNVLKGGNFHISRKNFNEQTISVSMTSIGGFTFLKRPVF